MIDTGAIRFVRRVRDRIGLAWEESRVSGTPVLPDPFAEECGESRFVPMRLAGAHGRFPATALLPTIASVERRIGASADEIRLISGVWVPTEASGVPAFAEFVRGWGRTLAPGERLFWAQPMSTNFVLSREEAEQLIGLAGRVDFVEETTGIGSGCRFLVAAAAVRRRACAVGLCWSADLVRNDSDRAVALRRLQQMPAVIRAGVHIFEAPGAESSAWLSGAIRIASALRTERNAVFGARVSDEHGRVADVAAAVAGAIGDEAAVRLQWIDSVASGDTMAAPGPIAPSIECDCSLSSSESSPARPYVPHGAYVPLAFDVRVPAARVQEDALIEVPRCEADDVFPIEQSRWRRLTTSSARLAGRALNALVDAPIEKAHHQLLEALDLNRRLAYLQALPTDRTSVGRWHEFHVYNWPPPPDSIARFVVFDASDLMRRNSALRGLEYLRSGATVVTGREFLDIVATAKRRGSTPAALRAQQIAAHDYLASGGREELTADSERLIDELPESLGATLEIGFGYGLTAKRIAGRATSYVGVDLQREQAQRLRSYGGVGLVADIHHLPLRSDAFDTIIADNVLEHAGAPLDVLAELRRVLRPGGRAYILIPPDATTSDFQIRTHLWKADERSVARAASLAGLRIVKLEVLSYTDLSVYGCFPASRGKTCLVVVERPSTAAERRAS